MRADQIVLRPVAMTEKANFLRVGNQVVFEVVRTANKIQIRKAVEELFNVKVSSVNTLLVRGKSRRMGRGQAKMQNWKKAIVTLQQGQSIDFFGGNEG